VLGTFTPTGISTVAAFTLARPGSVVPAPSVQLPLSKVTSEPAVVPPKLPVLDPPAPKASVPELDSTAPELVSGTWMLVPAPSVFSTRPALSIEGDPSSRDRKFSARRSNTPPAALWNSLVPPIPM
jgi:hypothetical protein